MVHQSRVEDAPGIKLKDLAANSTEGTSILAGFRLLLDRRSYPGTSRKRRSDYELVFKFKSYHVFKLMDHLSSKRPWSLFILFFITIVVIATSLVFVLGRLIDITTAVKVRHSATFGSKSSPMWLISIRKKPTKRLPSAGLVRTTIFHMRLNC